MEKYFLKENGEEIEFGDYIELTLSKKCGNASIYKTLGVTFTPDIVDILVDEGVVTVKEEPDNKYAGKANVNPSEEFDSIMKHDIISRLNKVEDAVSHLYSVVLGRDNGTKNTECSPKDL